MKLLTFLGISKYSQTTYTLDGKQHPTCYCPAAVAHFYRPETTLIVVTEAARDRHFETLADELTAVTRPVEVLIPDGHSEADLWGIFNAITEKVQDGDELVVDITNGFRSLPFLSFLAIAFLRMARQVTVSRVLYGAWEARDEQTDKTPVFDLTPFLTLLDWTIATDRFTRFGDASDLAGLLKKGIPPGPLMRDDLPAREIGKGLKGAANAMEEVSLALRLTRPLETMQASETLVQALQQAAPTISQKTPPFGLLAEQIRAAYQPLAQAEPLRSANWSENLAIQLDLIEWYLEKGQVVQALTLAREWLVSVLVYHFESESLIAPECRKPVENALNNEVERHKPKRRSPLHPASDAQLQAMPNHREVGKLWDKLSELRNDIAHVGMNPTPKKADKLRKEAQDIYPRFRKLAEALGIIGLNANHS